MELKSFEVADPESLIEEVSAGHRLTEGSALLVLVHHPSTRQQIVHVEALPIDCREVAWEDTRELIRETMQHMPLPPDGRLPEHTVVTVVVRPGLTVFGGAEMEWAMAWRYANHFRPTFDGGLILVTEHGWLDQDSGWAGHHPRMVDA